MMSKLQSLEWITLNIASVGWIAASLMDYLPIFVGVIVGLSIAALNIVRIVTEIKKWKTKRKAKEDEQD